MSSEGKKRRGTAGQTNAKNSPYRLNGWAPDWMARRVGVFRVGRAHSSGSVTMRGLMGGVLAQAMGYAPHGRYTDQMIAHAQDRCTSVYLASDGEDSYDRAEAA